jgi:hypothetical protein
MKCGKQLFRLCAGKLGTGLLNTVAIKKKKIKH